MKLYRTSVKEDLNVGVVFQHLAENYVNQVVWMMMVMGRVGVIMKMVLFQLLAENEVRWMRMLMAEKYVNEVGQKRKLRHKRDPTKPMIIADCETVEQTS